MSRFLLYRTDSLRLGRGWQLLLYKRKRSLDQAQPFVLTQEIQSKSSGRQGFDVTQKTAKRARHPVFRTGKRNLGFPCPCDLMEMFPSYNNQGKNSGQVVGGKTRCKHNQRPYALSTSPALPCTPQVQVITTEEDCSGSRRVKLGALRHSLRDEVGKRLMRLRIPAQTLAQYVFHVIYI